VALGVNGKIYSMNIDDRKARGNAFDGGLLFEPVPGQWTMAVSILNFGNNFHFESEDEKLPQTIVGGVAFSPLPDRLLLAMDVVDPQDDTVGVRAGAEWWVSSALSLRGGYDSSDDLGHGFTAGVGLRAQQLEAMFFPVRRLSFDYSFVPFAESAETGAAASIHNISVTLRFGDHD
jgi:hypothetical protein